MIDKRSLAKWRNITPWITEDFVIQDLVISRALIEIYNNKELSEQIIFRGGTAIQKLYYTNNPTRYSEDLDFVQISSGGIGEILDLLHARLDPWLGQPKTKIKQAVVTLTYKIPVANSPKLKIEINTEERFNVLPIQVVPFDISCPWFTGSANIMTYSIDELLATKLRALYQRKKGRDLFDLARAIENLPINIDNVIKCFQKYIEYTNTKISRAEFEENLIHKKSMLEFREDMLPLLPADIKFNFDDDLDLILAKIVTKLPGDPWRGK